MWLGGIHCHCCLSGFNNGILGSVFDNCSASPCVKPQRSPGHRSRPLAPVSAPRLQQLWGVKCPWPRRSQTSRGVPVPFATIACCDVWQANGGDTAWLLSPENSMSFQKRRRLWVLPLSSLAQHQSIANRTLCTVSSPPRNLCGKEIFPL